MRTIPLAISLLTLGAALAAAPADGPTAATVTIRGRQQTLHVYGTRGTGDPVVVTSGDGGWIHLAPHVAEALAARGFFVVGFDSRAYLASFTSSAGALDPRDEPGDYKTVIDFAAAGQRSKPILIGVSEGAGLSVLASTDPTTRQAIAGVIALGLPRLNELGWRWKDSLIYLTHQVPAEPTFSTSEVVGRMGGTPFAVIHSTNDEYTPVEEIRTILKSASEPTRLSLVSASNHRFSGNLPELHQRLLDAIAWIRQARP